MNALSLSEFSDFFQAIYGKPPFPWQQRLLRLAASAAWPRCIALPTAAGKTACIDVAIFVLACQANLSPEERTAPRRIFFVVDRRVVVDQAYEHGKALGEALAEAETGILKRVADALRSLGGVQTRPLDVYALRGGMYRENAWIRSPLQPTIITSTVDQVGSRLLFRGYGVTDSCKPLHAALVGNDALILLDEAHCSRPFEQTLALVEKYRRKSPQVLPSPFYFVSMTATPRPDFPEAQVLKMNEDDRNSVLGERIKTSKPAKLVVAKNERGLEWRQSLVNELIKQVALLSEHKAIGVIVNRVATAREAAQALRDKMNGSADVILLTGRMRPLDRDVIMEGLKPLLSGSPQALEKPIIVVATQCLEVGADLDFHALVAECASLDALRQRFGRLNRIASRSSAKAVVVIREDQVSANGDVDPVYGKALTDTWKWLQDNSEEDVFEFGANGVDGLTKALTSEQLVALNAPVFDAAVLLPEHLDAWCQTSPMPLPDPDVSYFLHGAQRNGIPDVQVVFRADLGRDEKKWSEIVSLCPPSSSEALPVRIDVFKRWLSGENTPDDSSDVEGESNGAEEEDGPADAHRYALRWRGEESSEIVTSDARLIPGGLYVVPSSVEDAALLGDFPDSARGDSGFGPNDLGDESFQRARDRSILRLSEVESRGVSADDEDLQEKILGVLDSLLDLENAKPENSRQEWMVRAIKSLKKRGNCSIKAHPGGGLVLISKRRLHQFDPGFDEAAGETSSDHPYHLDQHSNDVAGQARRFAEKLGLSQAVELELAGRLHDAGKADPRFQSWMHGGNARRALVYPKALAKPLIPMPTKQGRDKARRSAGYPVGGRHELFSVRLAERDNTVGNIDEDRRDLILHLIASHHGYCRPFAPVVKDKEAIKFAYGNLLFEPAANSDSGHGLERMDSGIGERFWKLTRRFGWWGVSWLETALRLADWSASRAAEISADSEFES